MSELKTYIQSILQEKLQKITPENIKKDVQIFDVVGTLESGTVITDATATSKDLRVGKIAYNNEGKITGKLTYGIINTQINSESELNMEDESQYLWVTPNTLCESEHIQRVDNNGDMIGIPYNILSSVLNLTPNVLLEGTNILNISGNVVQLKGEQLQVDPTTQQQIITPSDNYNGITQITINPVTKSIDNNILPENIKKEITVLGVTGTYEGDTSKDVTNYISTTTTEYFRMLNQITKIPEIDTSNATDMQETFKGFGSITTIPQINTSNVTVFSYTFESCSSLENIPEIDTSNAQSFIHVFSQCSSLVSIPSFNLSKCTDIDGAFEYCPLLSDDSLNNILTTLLTLTDVYEFDKTLKYIGLSQEQATKCTTLSNWSSCESSGWTTGY